MMVLTTCREPPVGRLRGPILTPSGSCRIDCVSVFSRFVKFLSETLCEVVLVPLCVGSGQAPMAWLRIDSFLEEPDRPNKLTPLGIAGLGCCVESVNIG